MPAGSSGNRFRDVILEHGLRDSNIARALSNHNPNTTEFSKAMVTHGRNKQSKQASLSTKIETRQFMISTPREKHKCSQVRFLVIGRPIMDSIKQHLSKEIILKIATRRHFSLTVARKYPRSHPRTSQAKRKE